MESKSLIKSHRLSGNYKDTVKAILTLPDHERTPFLLDLAFVQFAYEKYEDCLTFLLTYISREQPKTLSKMGGFIASELSIIFPNSPPLNQMIDYYQCPLPTKKPPSMFKITDFQIQVLPISTYVFSVQCTQCDHSFEINTNVTFLVDFNTPCPNCFCFSTLNSKMIQSFLSSSHVHCFNLNPTPLSNPLPPLIPELLFSYDYYLAPLLFTESPK